MDKLISDQNRKRERHCWCTKLSEVIWGIWVVSGYEFDSHLGGQKKKQTPNIASSGRDLRWLRCQPYAQTQRTRQQDVGRVEQLRQVKRSMDTKEVTDFH